MEDLAQGTPAPVDNDTSEIPDNAAPDSPETPAPKPNHYKIKANGKELELPLEEVLRRAEKAEGADERFRVASEKEKKAQELERRVSELKGKLDAISMDSDNFSDVIEAMGFEKAMKFANTLYQKQVEWNELSDAEKDRLLDRQRADRSEAELKRLRDAEEKRAHESALEQSVSAIDQEMRSAVKAAKDAGVPLADLPEVLELVADELLAYLEYAEGEEAAGRKPRGSPPSPEDVIKKISGRYEERSKGFVAKLSADQLRSMLTPEQLTALRKADLDQLQSPTLQSRTGSQSQTDDNENVFRGQDRKKYRDQFEYLEEKYGQSRRKK